MTARSDTINNNWGDSPKSVLHIYKELIAAGLRIWVFRSCSFPYTPLGRLYI